MKKTLLASLLLSLAAPALAQQQVQIKLGTLAPNGSTWHEILKEMAERWSQASNGTVKLRIYPGGTQGNEGEMIRKMAVGQLQGAAVTTTGLHDIAPEPQALGVPLMFDSAAELQKALPVLEPKLDALLQQKGYVALTWGAVGALKLFCTKPFKTPAEAAGAKVFAWEGDPGAVKAWKAAGFNPVVLSSTDIITSLQTGMIECMPNVPLYVLTARLFEKAPYMIDVNWGWVVGATVVRKDAWEKIPADLRPKLAAIARELGAKVDAEVAKLNTEAVTAMEKQGLKIVKVDPGPWRAMAEKSWPVIRGEVVPVAFFDEVKAVRDAQRAGKK
ncbi:MAG TPA: TRAP transporter substrate-binding protein DctP [Anaeromyxobacteraceae bacterium]|nr:TRAP transporter substrate-binding protein DctP [Anaeromyxobacteraceae bacterium]